MVMAMNLEQAAPSAAQSFSTKAALCGKVLDDRSEPTAAFLSRLLLRPSTRTCRPGQDCSILLSLPPPRASAPNYNEHHLKPASSALEGHPSVSLQRWTPGSVARPSLLKYFREECHLAYPPSELSQERFLHNHRNYNLRHKLRHKLNGP